MTGLECYLQDNRMEVTVLRDDEISEACATAACDVVLTDKFDYLDFCTGLAGKPCVYLSGEESARTYYSFPELCTVVTTSDEVAFDGWGIPDTVIRRLYSPLSFLPAYPPEPAYGDEPDGSGGYLYVFTDHSVHGLNVARNVISAFNHLSYSLKVVAAGTSAGLEKICNRNITVQVVEGEEDVYRHIAAAGVVLASGSNALKALYCKKKVIVVGPKGFGGEVVPATITKHIRENCAGRIGGQKDGPVPVPVLVHEINKITAGDPEALRADAEENFRILGTYYKQETFLRQLTAIIRRAAGQPGRVGSADALLPLRPVINYDYIVTVVTGESVLVRSPTGLDLFTLDVHQVELFMPFDGTKSVREVIDAFSLNGERKAHFFALIHMLWGKKVLSFRDEPAPDEEMQIPGGTLMKRW